MKARKLISLLLSLVLVLSACALFSSCGNNGKYTVGICQLVQHDALDAATNGFKQALLDELGKDNVTFLTENAQGDSATCSTIVNDFVNKNVDLIMANATPALQAAYSATTVIPILGTSVTDYEAALNLKAGENGAFGSNVSGTSDLVSYERQADFIKGLYPSSTHKKVAILYCNAEPNSVVQAESMKEILESATYGYTVTLKTFTDSNDVVAVSQSVAGKDTSGNNLFDLLYIPTDNTAASNSTAIYNAMVAMDNILPVITAEEGTAKGCGLATLTISYYDLGYQTGKMAAKILKGESDIKNMPVEYAENLTKKWNADIAEDLGITQMPEGFTAIEK